MNYKVDEVNVSLIKLRDEIESASALANREDRVALQVSVINAIDGASEEKCYAIYRMLKLNNQVSDDFIDETFGATAIPLKERLEAERKAKRAARR